MKNVINNNINNNYKMDVCELDKIDDKKILIDMIIKQKKDNTKYKIGLNEISKQYQLKNYQDTFLIKKKDCKIQLLELKINFYERLLQKQNDYHNNNNLLKENIIDLNRKNKEILAKKNKEIINLKKENDIFIFKLQKLHEQNNYLINEINNLNLLINSLKNNIKIKENETIIHNNYQYTYPQNESIFTSTNQQILYPIYSTPENITTYPYQYYYYN